LASKTTILGLKTPIPGMFINRYQYDTLARPRFRRFPGRGDGRFCPEAMGFYD
jgi:hypothetical protein